MQLLPLLQLGPIRLGLLALGNITENRQMMAGHEPRSCRVLDLPLRTVGADHAQLTTLFSRIEKALPRGVEVHLGPEKVVEPTAEQLLSRQAEQAAGGGVSLNEGPRIVDDDHGVTDGRERALGPLLSGHLS